MNLFFCKPNKKKYEPPVAEVITFDVDDVITTSYSNNLLPDMEARVEYE